MLGGDSAGISGYDISSRKDAKVFRRGPFAIGMCGSFRMGQLLRYALPDLGHPDGQDAHEFMVTTFIDAVRVLLTEGGLAKKEDNVEAIEGSFIVGYRGRLFTVEQDYQVGEERNDYTSVGCGAAYALGCLYQNKRRPPKARLIQALEAASKFSAGVRGPYTFAEAE